VTPEIVQIGESDGAVVLQAELLAATRVVHGFATRRGGVSEGSFASLNFGLKGGDDPANVRQNLERLGRAVGFDPSRFFRLRQVHGHDVRRIVSGDDPAAVAGVSADALVSVEPGVALGVLTADCVPVLFADVERGVIGAAHAGWRGVVAGVLRSTVEAMLALGAEREHLRAAIGPAIGPCCYEVGPEVVREFTALGAVREGIRPRVDLRAAARLLLEQAGVGWIADVDLCTRCHGELLFSYRRDGELCGHQLSVVGLRPVG
jgi:polyphenol oxidase